MATMRRAAELARPVGDGMEVARTEGASGESVGLNAAGRRSEKGKGRQEEEHVDGGVASGRGWEMACVRLRLPEATARQGSRVRGRRRGSASREGGGGQSGRRGKRSDGKPMGEKVLGDNRILMLTGVSERRYTMGDDNRNGEAEGGAGSKKPGARGKRKVAK